MSATSGMGRNRRSRNTVTTKSGNVIKVNRTMGDRLKTSKAARAAKHAAYLSTLPKNRWKRLAYRMHPKRVAQFWFSREGGIMALKIIGIAIVVGFFLTIGMFAYFRKDLPKIKDISGDSLPGSISYYDRTGKVLLWQDNDGVKRIPVQSNQISPYMKDATVAVEDKDFYKHGAFDVRGIMRAGLHDVFGGGGTVQGGSTITQQLVKLNENWTDNRTITRKVKELILAVELEREYSKSDILTGYLNVAPYSGTDDGVEAAAEDYFQTDAKDLTLPEAAMLAAIPQSPTYYSPYDSSQYNPAVTDDTFSSTALIDRQHYILDLMAQQGYITQAQANAAKQVNILAMVHEQTNKYQGIQAPYFVLAAKQQLEQQYGSSTVNRGGWKVITTLNMNLQNEAQKVVDADMPNVERNKGDVAAMVAENVQTGQIVSLIGGETFNDPNSTYGSLNYAAGVNIGPGSSFKPYDYSTLINDNNNVGAGSVLYDSEGPLPGYPCTNHAIPLKGGNCLEDFDYTQPGPITLRYALGGSRNIPAVKAMLEAVPGATKPGNVESTNGVKSDQKVIDTADAMIDNTYDEQHNLSAYNCYANVQQTITTQCYDASAIGDGAYLKLDDHVNGLATIARGGEAIPRTYILKITDSSGSTIYQWKQPKPTQVIKPDTAYIVNNMTSDPRASYLSGSCSTTNCNTSPIDGKFQRYNGWDFAVKTGTTQNDYDGLMTSWSTKYAIVSWVGNHTRQVALTAESDDLTEPIVRQWMDYAHKDLKPVNWTQPKDIKVLPAYQITRHVDFGSQEPSSATDLFPSWYVGGNSGKSTATTIDKVSDLTATACTPALAKEVIGNGNAASWNIDIFKGGKQNIGSTSSSSTSSGTNATDNVHNCNDSPPTINDIYIDDQSGNNDVKGGGTAACSTSCLINVNASGGTHPLSGGSYTTSPAGTVTISVGGHVIKTCDISTSDAAAGSTQCSVTYTPTTSGNFSVQATVVDSVLYEGASSGTINATAPVAGPANFTAVINGSFVDFSWTGGTAPYNVYANGSSTPLATCSNVSATSCTAPKAQANVGTSVVLKDENDNTASTDVAN